MEERLERIFIVGDKPIRYFIDDMQSDGEKLKVTLKRNGVIIYLSFFMIIKFTVLDESYMGDYFKEIPKEGSFRDHSLYLVVNSRWINRIKRYSPEYESVNMTNYLIFDGMRFIDIVITGDLESEHHLPDKKE